jgi:hypothetical protein
VIQASQLLTPKIIALESAGMDIAGPSKAEEYYGGHGRGNQFYDFSGVEFLS